MKLYCIGIALVFMANTLTLTLACEDITDAFTITLDDGSTLQKTCKQARKNPWGQVSLVQFTYVFDCMSRVTC